MHAQIYSLPMMHPIIYAARFLWLIMCANKNAIKTIGVQNLVSSPAFSTTQASGAI